MATRRYRTGIENNENSILSKNSTTGSTKAFTSTTTTSLSSTNRSISRSGSNSNSIKTNNTTTKSTVTNAKTTVPSRSVSASSRKPLTDLSTTASNKLNTNRPVTNGSSRTTTTTMTGKNMNTSTKNDGNYVTSSALLSPTPAPSVSKIPGTAYKANNNNSNTVLSGSSTSSTVITLPSITNALRTIYTKDLRDEYKNNYTQVINAKIKKIDWSSNYQDRKKEIAQIIETYRDALQDSAFRSNEAMNIAEKIENEITSCFVKATQLEGKLREVSSSKGDVEALLAKVQEKLAESQADLEQATCNENAANEEVDKANNIIQELEVFVQERDDKIKTLEEKLEEMEAINTGLEDDKEELETVNKKLKSDLEKITVTAKHETEHVRSIQIEATNAHKRIAELEKMVSLGEIDFTKLRNERDNAVQSRTESEQELKRIQAALEAKESAITATMANFNRTAELQFTRERETAAQISNLTDRLNTMTKERDDLRATETQLKVDLREAHTRENQLQNEVTKLSHQQQENLQKIEQMHNDINRFTTELSTVRGNLEKALADASSTKTELEEKLAIVTGKWAEVTDKLRIAAETELDWKNKELSWTTERTILVTEKTKAEETNATLTKELETLRETYGASEESKEMKLCEANKANVLLKRRVAEMKILENKVLEAEARANRLQEGLFASEMKVRALHNTVQEMKGNIRVYVRVRPFLPADNDTNAAKALMGITDDDGEFSADPTPAATVSPDGTTIEMIQPPPRTTKDGPAFLKRDTKPIKFNFDQVFGQRCTQEDIFNEVSHLVQSALDGYHVCLFSYGQTGSGKTHTMQGSYGDQAGLVPRSVLKILEEAEYKTTQGWKYSIEASFLEIYNEQIRDLLRVSKPTTTTTTTTTNRNEVEPTNLVVHQDDKGNIDVPGLTRVPIDSSQAVDNLMVRAAKKRAVASTAMNNQSSRSHSVFSLYLRGEHLGKGIALNGVLNLVDLAGSERLSRSAVEGDRMKETLAINKSLTCLIDVFTALANKAAHIPFRNSKLTQLLQNCFRGDGKTLMLVNLSPTMASAQESLCSLRFAAKVSQVELGKPKKRAVEVLSNGNDNNNANVNPPSGTTLTSQPHVSRAPSSSVLKSSNNNYSSQPSSNITASTSLSSSFDTSVNNDLLLEDIDEIHEYKEEDDLLHGENEIDGVEGIMNENNTSLNTNNDSLNDESIDDLEEENDMIGFGSSYLTKSTINDTNNNSVNHGTKRSVNQISGSSALQSSNKISKLQSSGIRSNGTNNTSTVPNKSSSTLANSAVRPGTASVPNGRLPSGNKVSTTTAATTSVVPSKKPAVPLSASRTGTK